MIRLRRSGPLTCALLATAGALLGCASDGVRCGRSRVASAPRAAQRGGPPAGPYCLVVEAEGVGNLNVQVNEPVRSSGGEDEPDAVGPDGQPLAPLLYTLSAPQGVRFIDACALPTARRVLAGVDDSTAQIPEPDAPPIPFPVRLYDVLTAPPYTVASNGWLALVAGAPMGSLSGAVPASAAPNLTAAPYWTDLVTRGGICYATVGAAPNRSFVVEWEDVYEFGGGGTGAHLTFEVVIHAARPPLAHNVIDFVYDRIDGAQRPTVGAGIENNDGTVGVTVPPPLTGAQRFTPSR